MKRPARNAEARQSRSAQSAEQARAAKYARLASQSNTLRHRLTFHISTFNFQLSIFTLPSTPKSLSTTTGIITVILTLTGWASVPLFLRHYADLIDFWTSNGWRYGFSALLWLPVLIIAGLRSSLPKGLFIAAIVPSIVNALGQVCFTAAHYFI